MTNFSDLPPGRTIKVVHSNIDRSEVNRALAKALAYKQCGKQAEAEKWAETLVYLLECGKILRNGR